MKGTKSKNHSLAKRIANIGEFKDKWTKENEELNRLAREKRELELKRVQEASMAAAEMRRKNLEKKKEYDLKQKQTELEMLAASVQARTEQAAELERLTKEKRRKSVLLNEEIIKSARQKQQKMNADVKEEERSILETRRIASLNAQAAKRTEKEMRRQSLVSRGIISKKQKQKLREMTKRQQEDEKENLEFRKIAWINKQQSKEEEKLRKRESLCNRGKMFQMQKKIEIEIEKAESVKMEEDFTIRSLEWADVQEGVRAERQRARESLAFRLDKWREEKKQRIVWKSEQAEVEELESVLRSQELEDIQAYRDRQRHSRRESLISRMEKARKDKAVEAAERAARELIQQEEARLRQQDAEDMRTYRETLLAERRKSMEYRNQTEFQEKMRLQGEKAAESEEQARSRALSEAAWRDVKEYQEREREANRKELAERILHSRQQQQIMLELHRQQLDQLQDQLEARRVAWFDQQSFHEEMKQKRRQSVSMRLESWRIQRMQEEREKAIKRFEMEEEAMIREQEREDLNEMKRKMKLEQLQEINNPGFIF